jgi:predicted nucleotidyltransferase
LKSLKPILYFSIFKYPLTKEEIFEFSDCASIFELEQELTVLLKKEIVFKIHDYYSITNNPELITRRTKGNTMAKEILPKAKKVAKFIGKFPYVESVSLSGALAKGYYDEDGDFDFFIITKPNRLWVARTLLIFYKKIFLLNSKKYFCVNYFITSSQLQIVEKNRFTASEIVTLIPVSGKDTFTAFLKENTWVKTYLPNKKSINTSSIIEVNKNLGSKSMQLILNNNIGSSIYRLFQKITLKKWSAKFGYLKKEEFDIAMKSTKDISKHHPQNFQKKVIDLLNEKYKKVKIKYNIELPPEHA